MSKALFVAAGPYTFASSRLRCYWPARYMKDTEVVERRLLSNGANAEVMIWQKQVDHEMIRAYPNRRHYWDVCDPAWWWAPDDAREVADMMTGVVASSEALRDDFNHWYGSDKAVCIPDRLELEHFPATRVHKETNPVRFIWFGLSLNRIAIFAQLANLERLVANGHNIELTIYDEQPSDKFLITDMFPINHIKWNVDEENRIIALHDIALLPPYPGPWGRVKSNNKRLTAWACGLPAITDHSYGDIACLVKNVDIRIEDSKIDLNHVKSRCSVERSSYEWEALLQ